LYRFPEIFYWDEPNTTDSISEWYQTKRIELDNSFLYAFAPNIYAGGIHRFQQLYNLKFQEGSHMVRDQITGIDGGVANGLGNAGNNVTDLFDRIPMYSFGSGLRFQIDNANRGNIRLDFALGQNSSGIYLSYGECF